MPTPPPPPLTSVEALISLLLNCVCEALNSSGRPVCGCSVRHAVQWPSMEACGCDCAAGQGQAWARLQRVEAFNGTQNADDTNCGGATTTYIDVGVHRCVSVFDGESPYPATDAAYTADALGLIHDEYVMRRAVACCPRADVGLLANWSWRPTQSLPLGPLGGCAGIVVTVLCQGPPRIAAA